ncbi:MAG: hypothetical protein AUH81_04255 [Candidatus Rokubacteria bacterium 13_1_40CM_4_69_5]|nr:MAG: hypothetical protein AUH81_04255 [Candidatus Rokubacteria bacterium 13_1_40CM_4_69_5]
MAEQVPGRRQSGQQREPADADRGEVGRERVDEGGEEDEPTTTYRAFIGAILSASARYSV